MAADWRLSIKNTNKNPISRVLLLLTGGCLPPQFLPLLFLLSVPSPLSSQQALPLRQATHLVSFLLALSPLPRSNKGANHDNWHPAGQLSQLGEVPHAEVWAIAEGDIHGVLPLQLSKTHARLVLSL